MPTETGPHDLATTPVIMTPHGSAVAKAFSDTFFTELDTEFDNFKAHTLVMTFAFDEAWPTWEIHPEGDELVYLIEGDTDFLLRTTAGEKTIRVSEPGSYVIVPKATWHTARPHAPTRMLFVTPGEGTLNEAEPPSS